MLKANFNTYASYTTDSLYQWDKDQNLIINGLSLSTAPEIHFANSNMDRAIVRQAELKDGAVIVKIPNSILQEALTIKAYVGVYEGSTFTIIERVDIPVIAKARPSDYSLTDEDEEVYSFIRLENLLVNSKRELEISVENTTRTLNARVNNIISNSNTVDNNSELVDIRVGANGTTYATAGEAVRAQIKAITYDAEIIAEHTDAIAEITNNVTEHSATIIEHTTAIAEHESAIARHDSTIQAHTDSIINNTRLIDAIDDYLGNVLEEPVIPVQVGDMQIRGNALLDLQNIEIGDRVSLQDFGMTGDADMMGDIRLVKAGQILDLSVNTYLNAYPVDMLGNFGVIITDGELLVRHVKFMPEILENQGRYTVPIDGYAVVYLVGSSSTPVYNILNRKGGLVTREEFDKLRADVDRLLEMMSSV